MKLQKEAKKKLAELKKPVVPHLSAGSIVPTTDAPVWQIPLFTDGKLRIKGLVYRTYDSDDYNRF